ncbi:MAG: hypothetical protein Q9168_002232 [Polycauliona sp. 1 TL-2023]
MQQVTSTLSILEPFRRVIGGIPFLYQRVSSTSPVTALISPKPACSSLAVVHLDGSTDWMVIGRSLLAWTGQTLSVRPTISPKLVRFMVQQADAKADLDGEELRALGLNDVLTDRQVDEIAEAPGGTTARSSPLITDLPDTDVSKQATKSLQMSTASMGPDGKIVFEKDKSSEAR